MLPTTGTQKLIICWLCILNWTSQTWPRPDWRPLRCFTASKSEVCRSGLNKAILRSHHCNKTSISAELKTLKFWGSSRVSTKGKRHLPILLTPPQDVYALVLLTHQGHRHFDRCEGITDWAEDEWSWLHHQFFTLVHRFHQLTLDLMLYLLSRAFSSSLLYVGRRATLRKLHQSSERVARETAFQENIIFDLPSACHSSLSSKSRPRNALV